MLQLLEKLRADRDTQLWHFCRRQPVDLYQLSLHLNERIVLLRQIARHGKCLVHDGRWRLDEDTPISYWLWTRRRCIRRVARPDAIDGLDHRRFEGWLNPKPLWELLNLEQPAPDPQSLAATRTWFSDRASHISRDVNVVFVSHFVKRVPVGRSVTLGRADGPELVVWAWPKSDFTLGFSLAYKNRLPAARNKRHKVESDQIDRGWSNARPAADKFARNNATAVTVACRGLTLARFLRLVSPSEMEELSEKLGRTAGALHCQFDDAGHLRHVTYSDEKRSFSVRIGCFVNEQGVKDRRKEEAAAQVMRVLFDRLWQYRTRWLARRRFVLARLLAKLATFPAKVPSLHRSCRLHLEQTIQRQMILLHGEGDDCLRALQLYFADFVKSQKPVGRQTRATVGVKIRDGRLYALHSLKLTLFNVQAYVDNEKSGGDVLFYGNDWYEPASPLPCLPADLRHHRPSFGNLNLTRYLGQRGLLFSTTVRKFWLRLGKTFLQLFGVDLHSHAAYKSLGQWSYECVMLKAVQSDGPLHQGPEKTKAFYQDLYRLSSHGGFMYSAKCKLEAGDPLDPDDPNSPSAASVSEYDLNSAYGYSGGQCRLPGGFCVGYVKPSLYVRPNEGDCTREFNVDVPADNELLVRADRCRSQGFEFRATYYVIHKLLQKTDRVVHAWHNYSSLGLAHVGPYPLDLAVITERGRFLCYQFDGCYFHACKSCPPLARYADGCTRAQLLERNARRDRAIQEWIAQVRNAKYEVLTDCHDLTAGVLNLAFARVPQLNALTRPYPGNARLDPKLLLAYLATRRDAEDYTFVAWVTAQTALPSFMVPKDGPGSGDDLLADTGSRRVALIRECFEELLDRQALRLNQIDAVLFYRTWPALGEVYRELTRRRYVTTDAVQADFIKKFVNLSCGYMGLRDHSTGRVRHTLTNGRPQRFNWNRHQFDPTIVDNGFEHLGQAYFYLATLQAPPEKPRARRPCRAALPLYFFIVEHAKLRLLQFLHVLMRHLPASRWRLLYSNVDNVILATSGSTLVETASSPDERSALLGALEGLVAEAKLPGHFKREWCYNDPSWKVVTSRVMELALLSESRLNLYRRSGPGTSDPRLGYEAACQALWQPRRRPLEEPSPRYV